MSLNLLPNRLKSTREKVFGTGRPRPLDREAKLRLMTKARALSRRVEKGRHYGPVSAKALAVLEALLWGFHNAKSGLCFPSYEAIADRAGCARSTVAEAIKALEDAGLMSWVNRITRIREYSRDLFGQWAPGWRVIRTSNAYHFIDPSPGASRAVSLGNSSKSDLPSGTGIQDLLLSTKASDAPNPTTGNAIEEALRRLGDAIGVSAAASGPSMRPA